MWSGCSVESTQNSSDSMPNSFQILQPGASSPSAVRQFGVATCPDHLRWVEFMSLHNGHLCQTRPRMNGSQIWFAGRVISVCWTFRVFCWRVAASPISMACRDESNTLIIPSLTSCLWSSIGLGTLLFLIFGFTPEIGKLPREMSRLELIWRTGRVKLYLPDATLMINCLHTAKFKFSSRIGLDLNCAEKYLVQFLE